MDIIDLKKLICEELSGFFEAYEFDYNKTFIPPVHVATIAKRALGVIVHNDMVSHGGNEGSGKSKARSLANKEPQNHSMMKRLKAFFDKNSEAVAQERRLGKNISSSGIIQAWELHGGDAGMKWVNHEIKKVNDSNLNTKKTLRKIGGAGINKGLGTMDVTQMDPTKQRIHR
jgi:hypothetical protein